MVFKVKRPLRLAFEREEKGEDSCRIKIWDVAITFPASLGGEIWEDDPVISDISITGVNHCALLWDQGAPLSVRFVTVPLRREGRLSVLYSRVISHTFLKRLEWILKNIRSVVLADPGVSYCTCLLPVEHLRWWGTHYSTGWHIFLVGNSNDQEFFL